MKIGVPTEVKSDEYRVSVVPSGVRELVKVGAQVYVQKGAGEGSGFSDAAYVEAGAILVATAQELFSIADAIIKVKEPIATEYALFKEGHILFTYLHLAADEALTRFLVEKKIHAFAYETLQEDGRLPLLEPMSEVAGKMAALMGSVHLGKYHGGSGILAGGVIGTKRANVLILGGGIAGKCAAEVSAGLGANVTIFDINTQRLNYLDAVLPANVATMYSTQMSLEEMLPSADVIIGTVLVAGAKAPKLITKPMLKLMKAGSVLVDVSIDQGGCFETSKPTTHSEPTFVQEGIVHYCVANMPGAYPQTSTQALTNATLRYVVALAQHGVEGVCQTITSMQSALNTYNGQLVNAAVGEAHGMKVEKYR